MAELAGTTNTYDNVGMRESLEDVIYDLFPLDTWAVTNLERNSKVNSTFHEWQIDALGGATANRQVEGNDGSFATIVAPTRVGNFLQISTKAFLISGTVEAATYAGRKSEVARQGMKQMKGLKRKLMELFAPQYCALAA